MTQTKLWHFENFSMLHILSEHELERQGIISYDRERIYVRKYSAL